MDHTTIINNSGSDVTSLQCRVLTLWTPTPGVSMDERENRWVMVGMKLPGRKLNYFM